MGPKTPPNWKIFTFCGSKHPPPIALDCSIDMFVITHSVNQSVLKDTGKTHHHIRRVPAKNDMKIVYTTCTCTQHVCVPNMYGYTTCTCTHHVRVHNIHVYTTCTCTQHVRVHNVYVYTCMCTQHVRTGDVTLFRDEHTKNAEATHIKTDNGQN